MKKTSAEITLFDLKKILLEKIKQKGGWVNGHTHLDRSHTINDDNFALGGATLQEKWDLVDTMKRENSVSEIYDRMARTLEEQIKQGVTAIGSFIDVDPVIKDKAILAAQKLRDRYKKDIKIKFINQVLKGVLSVEARYWFDIGAQFVDIIGGLPGKDAGREDEHLDILLGTAKMLGKMVHVHVDQLNSSKEKETELLAKKTIEYGMEDRVVAIHGVSIAAHKKAYRLELYELVKKAKLIFVTCPSAWIDSRRTEIMAPSHNAILPVDEMTPLDIPIAIGTDNIADIYKPFSDGDMWTELRFLLESCHYYDVEKLVDIATTNGLQSLGIAREIPFFDPEKTYEENFKNGPYGVFANNSQYKNNGLPRTNFLGREVNLPFGIPAGPLLNGNYVKAALDHGFDIAVYKTVRSRAYKCASWPNVLAVKVKGNLDLEKAEAGVTASHNYSDPISITNSFGVPSYDPDFWQKDLSRIVKGAKDGQMVIGSFQGTIDRAKGSSAYISDFVKTARLVAETKVHALETNLSCPNEGTSHLLCFDIERTTKIISAIKNQIGDIPLIIKIAYFNSQPELEKLITAVGKMIEGISAINTIPAKIYDEKGAAALPGDNRLRSGVCGAAIRWAGLEMVSRLKKLREKTKMKFAIIGVGGVTIPEDYFEYKKAGADAVMSATGAMWNPHLAEEIKTQL